MELTMEKRYLTWNQCIERAIKIREQLKSKYHPSGLIRRVYAIPNGGIPAALILCGLFDNDRDRFTLEMVVDPTNADIYVDDIIDSGATRDKYSDKPFYALLDKQEENIKDTWVVFPWEQMQNQTGPEDCVLRLLQYIGEDTARPGLLETPKRVVKSYEELFSGYKANPQDHLKIFEEVSSDAMITLKDVEFYSHCEHHMAPFFGKAQLAYIPNFTAYHTDTGVQRRYRVLGASKLSRIFDCFARRLQIQERIGAQFTEYLMKSDLKPLGVACRIEATHFCICSRGVGKQHSKLVTTSLEGVFVNQEVRGEFLSSIRS